MVLTNNHCPLKKTVNFKKMQLSVQSTFLSKENGKGSVMHMKIKGKEQIKVIDPESHTTTFPNDSSLYERDKE